MFYDTAVGILYLRARFLANLKAKYFHCNTLLTTLCNWISPLRTPTLLVNLSHNSIEVDKTFTSIEFQCFQRVSQPEIGEDTVFLLYYFGLCSIFPVELANAIWKIQFSFHLHRDFRDGNI